KNIRYGFFFCSRVFPVSTSGGRGLPGKPEPALFAEQSDPANRLCGRMMGGCLLQAHSHCNRQQNGVRFWRIRIKHSVQRFWQKGGKTSRTNLSSLRVAAQATPQ